MFPMIGIAEIWRANTQNGHQGFPYLKYRTCLTPLTPCRSELNSVIVGGMETQMVSVFGLRTGEAGS